jgi:hypothetical protein
MAVDLGYDEGGSGDTLLVSLQLGIHEQVKKLKRRWKSSLGDDLPFFHSKDYGNYRSGVFTKAELSRQDRQELLTELVALIHRYLVVGVTTRVSKRLYEKATTPAFRSRYGTAYGFLIDMCLLTSYNVMTDLSIRPEVNILIEDGHPNCAQAVSLLEEVKKVPQDQLGINLKILTVGLGPKADHPILQAADMVAYAQWQRITKGDHTIWDALRAKTSKYLWAEVDCDERVIEEFVAGPRRFAEYKRQKWLAGRKR